MSVVIKHLLSMSIKTKNRHLNGSPLITTGELMDNPDLGMPSETLKAQNIEPSISNTEVQSSNVQAAPPELKAKKKKSAPPDTGHNVNYYNFGQLICFVKDIDVPPYSPPGTRLPVVQLEALYAAADAALQKLQVKNDAETAARNLRQDVFAPAAALGTQVGGQLAACDASKKMLKDYRTFMNELTGKRAKAIKPNDGKKHTSASHTTFANRLWAWNGIVTLCEGFPDYESNEEPLSLDGLKAVKDAMVDSNAAVQKAKAQADKARKERDRIFYAAKESLVPVALDVKD